MCGAPSSRLSIYADTDAARGPACGTVPRQPQLPSGGSQLPLRGRRLRLVACTHRDRLCGAALDGLKSAESE